MICTKSTSWLRWPLPIKAVTQLRIGSPFCIFPIMNEILLLPELMDIFLVGNHTSFFRKIIKWNTVNILKSTNENCQKIIPKSGHKMDLYPAMHFALWTMGRSDRFNIGLIRNEKLLDITSSLGTIAHKSYIFTQKRNWHLVETW